MSVNQESNKGIFLNGKSQIIEMLKALPSHEREKLLRLIIARNPSMGRELQEKSFSFNNLISLNDQQIRLVIANTNAQILGIALKGCEQKLQRKILSLAPREYAESAYETLLSNIKNELKDINRAQEKVLQIVVQVLRKTENRARA